MSTCNRLELQTLGSQPVNAQNLPDHWYGGWKEGVFVYYEVYLSFSQHKTLGPL